MKAERELSKLGLASIKEQHLMSFIAKQGMIWTVTMHTGRKLKKYPEI